MREPDLVQGTWNRRKVHFGIFLLIVLFQAGKILAFRRYPYFEPASDGIGYIDYLEHLYASGTYSSDGMFAGRMPGFLPVYLPLRLFFSPATTLFALGWLQVVLYAASVVRFSERMASLSASRPPSFEVILALLLGLSDYPTEMGNSFYTESLATSCMLLSFSFLVEGVKKGSEKRMLIAGLFAAWMVFLRPFMVAVLAALALYVVAFSPGGRSKRVVLACSLVLSFVGLDGVWVARNLRQEGRFIPLQSTMMAGGTPSAGYSSYVKFINSFGGDRVWWNPDTVGMWFQPDHYLRSAGFRRPSMDVFPGIVFSSTFSRDDVVQLRDLYWRSRDAALPPELRASSEGAFVKRVDDFVREFRAAHPLYYHVGARLVLLKGFLFHPYTYYLAITNGRPPVQLVLKAAIYLVNATVFVLGMLALLAFLRESLRFRREHVLVQLVPLFLVTLFPMVLRDIEYRYVVLGFPFLAHYAALVLAHAPSFLRRGTGRTTSPTTLSA